MLVLPACDRSTERPPSQTVSEEIAAPRPTAANADRRHVISLALFDNYRETGDLPAIRQRGKLRLLVAPSYTAALPRKATQQAIEIEQARSMARELGLELVILQVKSFDELIERLNAGEGDLIANNLLITEERRKLVDFSDPTAETHMVLVSATGTAEVKQGQKLPGKTLVVTRGTAFEAAATDFAARHAGLTVKARDTNYIDLLIDVALGKADFTIVDQQALDVALQFRDNLKANRVFPEKQQLAWAIRKGSPQLLQTINEQVRQLQLIRPGRRSTGDLGAIRKRGVLRAVTRNHPGTYYMWRGQILGFEFNLLENYADTLGVRLDVIVAEDHEDFVRLLRNGEADVCASLLAITDRHRAEGMAFSEPYLDSATGIVARAGDKLAGIQDLASRTLCVRPNSSQFGNARALQKQVDNIELELVPDELGIQQVIDRVANEECDLAIADEISVRLEQAWRDDIDFALALPIQKKRYAWMVRSSNPELLESINRFFAKPTTDDRLLQLYKRYFNTPKTEQSQRN